MLLNEKKAKKDCTKYWGKVNFFVPVNMFIKSSKVDLCCIHVFHHTPRSHLALHMTGFRGILGESPPTVTLYSIRSQGQTNFK